ncbi:MAG: hypothetical protein ACK5MR_09925 [Cumulibacter sp.]
MTTTTPDRQPNSGQTQLYDMAVTVGTTYKFYAIVSQETTPVDLINVGGTRDDGSFWVEAPQQ